MPIKQIFHHCDTWEETPMWQKLMDFEREAMIPKAVQFTSNDVLYGKWMLKVLDMWPISCEQNLSNRSINRKAWIGHAAAFLAIGSPEDVTRAAWWKLTPIQQETANIRAQIAIDEWERRYEAKQV